MNLQLISDAFGNHQTKGETQHFKIWNKDLKSDEIEKEINKSSLTKSLVYFINSYGQKNFEHIRKKSLNSKHKQQSINNKGL